MKQQQCEHPHNYNYPYNKCYLCGMFCCHRCVNSIFLKPPRKEYRKIREELICNKCKNKWDFLS